jgi:hypothetical protein
VPRINIDCLVVCISVNVHPLSVHNNEVTAYSFLFHGPRALVGQSLLLDEVSRSHSVRHTTFGRTPLDV